MGKGKAAETKKRKKKGRPSLLDLQKRTLQQQGREKHHQPKILITPNPNFTATNRQSTRRNPSSELTAVKGDGFEDDDDERKEKKVKLVVRLSPSNHHQSVSLNSASEASDSNADGEAPLEKPKINDFSHRSAGHVLEKVQKDALHGSTLDSGPSTPLPDKKLVVFILDRLQKKDTYGVFSEPVDPDELPDYHEIIDHPMDFQTVRKKLDEECYSNLDEFESDVFLICCNAMQYNAPDTIYFRQARAIQELAKRDLKNLRQVDDDGEPQPRIVRRGRPPSKNLKSSFDSPTVDRVECSSDATLATGGSNSYYPRRESTPFRLQSNVALFRTSNQFCNNETNVDSSIAWNSEFPASILRAEAKSVGKKQFSLDENRRATYKQFHPSTFGQEYSVLTNLSGDMKQLVKVGLHAEHGYARSVARFAANLGPSVWKIASKKIKSCLPCGVEFGPGWVGVNDASPWTQPKSSNKKSCCNEDTVGLNSDCDSSVDGINPGPSFQTPKQHMLNAVRNGFMGSHTDFMYQMSSAPSQMLGSFESISNPPSTAPDSQTTPQVVIS